MDITAIVNAVIALLVAIITTFVIPYVKSKTTEEQRHEVMQWTKIAVEAAEMIYRESGMGEKKKAYVEAFLIEKGLVFDVESIDALIEAAVLELKRSAV